MVRGPYVMDEPSCECERLEDSRIVDVLQLARGAVLVASSSSHNIGQLDCSKNVA